MKRDPDNIDVLLVCSTGGHLLQLHALEAAWVGTRHTWVTFDKSDARSLLAGEDVVFAYGPTNRSLVNLGRNLVLAARLLRRLRPRVIVTTGAGVAVPFCWLGRLLGARVVYVESLSRITAPSLSCRLIAPVATRLYSQWPELASSMRRARYVGSVFSR
ncbi:MAG: PssD/Cps14F family polysaccharide biosynthesis glycosyltransferase [Gaiellaceae bacterium]